MGPAALLSKLPGRARGCDAAGPGEPGGTPRERSTDGRRARGVCVPDGVVPQARPAARQLQACRRRSVQCRRRRSLRRYGPPTVSSRQLDNIPPVVGADSAVGVAVGGDRQDDDDVAVAVRPDPDTPAHVAAPLQRTRPGGTGRVPVVSSGGDASALFHNRGLALVSRVIGSFAIPSTTAASRPAQM